MSNEDVGPLAQYNSLTDKHLSGFFKNTRMKKHLRRQGLINRRGEVVSETTYRVSCAKKEHKYHVRELLAQAIVHKTLDMERVRQVEIRQKLENMAKFELVRRIRNERQMKGDESVMPYLSPRPIPDTHTQTDGTNNTAPSTGGGKNGKKPSRPMSAHHKRGRAATSSNHNRPNTVPEKHALKHNKHNIPLYTDASGLPVLKTYDIEDVDSQYLNELSPQALRHFTLNVSNMDYGSGISPYTIHQESHSPRGKGKKYLTPVESSRSNSTDKNKTDRRLNKRKQINKDRPPLVPQPRPAWHWQARESGCEMSMEYRGSRVNVDPSGHDIVEVTVIQQHCGGNTVILFRDLVEAKSKFTFVSKRHHGYPFSVTCYVDGLLDTKLSSCCEYKYRPGRLLGGREGRFLFTSIKGSTPCFRCQAAAGVKLPKIQTIKSKEPEKTVEKKNEIKHQEKVESNEQSYEDDEFNSDSDSSTGSTSSKHSQKSNTSQQHDDEHRTTPVVADGDESTPVVADGDESTRVVADGDESTPVVADGDESTRVVAEGTDDDSDRPVVERFDVKPGSGRVDSVSSSSSSTSRLSSSSSTTDSHGNKKKHRKHITKETTHHPHHDDGHQATTGKTTPIATEPKGTSAVTKTTDDDETTPPVAVTVDDDGSTPKADNRNERESSKPEADNDDDLLKPTGPSSPLPPPSPASTPPPTVDDNREIYGRPESQGSDGGVTGSEVYKPDPSSDPVVIDVDTTRQPPTSDSESESDTSSVTSVSVVDNNKPLHQSQHSDSAPPTTVAAGDKDHQREQPAPVKGKQHLESSSETSLSSSSDEDDDNDLKSLVKDLADVNVNGMILKDQQLTDCCQLLSRTDVIKSLEISGCGINDTSIEHITDSLISNKANIESLDVSNNQITVNGIQSIVSLMKKKRSLTSINVSNNPIGDNGCTILIGGICGRILSRSSSASSTSDQGRSLSSDELATVAVSNAIVTATSDDTDHDDDLNIAELDLSSTSLTSGAAMALVTLIKKSNSLKIFKISNNKSLDQRSWMKILRSLERNRSISQIFLDGCDLGDSVGVHLSTHLDMNPCLNEINLSSNQMTDTSVDSLISLANHNVALRSITLLPGNYISQENMDEIQKILHYKNNF